jgi:hypothetical protein
MSVAADRSPREEMANYGSDPSIALSRIGSLRG